MVCWRLQDEGVLAVHRDATFTEADAASAAVAPEQDSRMAVGDPSAPAFAAAARMEHQSEANALRQQRGQVHHEASKYYQSTSSARVRSTTEVWSDILLQAALLLGGGATLWFAYLDLVCDICQGCDCTKVWGCTEASLSLSTNLRPTPFATIVDMYTIFRVLPKYQLRACEKYWRILEQGTALGCSLA